MYQGLAGGIDIAVAVQQARGLTADQIQANAARNSQTLRAAGVAEPASPRLIEYGPGIREIPNWCNEIWGADFLPQCQPYSDAELHALSVYQLSKIAAVNPELAAAGLAAADASQKAMEADNPADTCQWNAAVNHPTLVALFGPKLVCGMGGGGSQDAPSVTPYLVLGGIALAVLVALK